jgi:hypothetical protein
MSEVRISCSSERRLHHRAVANCPGHHWYQNYSVLILARRSLRNFRGRSWQVAPANYICITGRLAPSSSGVLSHPRHFTCSALSSFHFVTSIVNRVQNWLFASFSYYRAVSSSRSTGQRNENVSPACSLAEKKKNLSGAPAYHAIMRERM